MKELNCFGIVTINNPFLYLSLEQIAWINAHTFTNR